jgi:transcriptional regulator with XRE-family HTH domain
MDLSMHDDPLQALASAMRAARLRSGLSQRQLADVLGWDRARVGRWETGHGPAGVSEADEVLRMLGFGLQVVERFTPPDLPEPVEHVADRGGRLYPAHLRVGYVGFRNHEFTRYGLATNPNGEGWGFRRLRLVDDPHAGR